MAWLLEPFSVTFMQRALAAVVALAVIGGVLGAWIVLRRLAFFSHAVGTATFPGLVLAGPVGLAPPLAALASAAGFAALAARLARRGGGLGPDAVVGLLLVGSLALGAVLASDVFASGPGVDRLLFGTLLGLTGTDLAVAGGVAALTSAAALLLGRTWLATGFDPGGARALGVPGIHGDRALLVAVAAAVVATLPAVGALLVATLLAVPAATARLVTRSLGGLVTGAVAVALLDGVTGLWLAYWLDLPPGPVIAVVGGLVFALAAASAALGRRGTVAA
ncbi:MAG TPA: metal ABC transporter permease [Solirubrobacteraceae bacterium]|nr:metal ABC transporter permease [Solirubrobacteraceae bacterium]